MISSILQYSTIDFRFLETNLVQLSKFSDEIIIPICDHFFNGELEDEKLLAETCNIAAKFPKCSVYMFEWTGPNANPGYYHNVSRALGSQVSNAEWLLFVDTDEIVDDSFVEWFETIKHTDKTYWLTCNWYFREPTYRATTTEGAGLLIRKKYCDWRLDIREERQQMFRLPNLVDGNREPVLSLESKPMIHHFSWVRSKQDMLKKVRNWGHKHDKNWIECVEAEFQKEFDGTDFVHGYNYNIVPNKFNI